ncbi:MAG: formyltransferase family protein [Prolixibacteraceae bacterium]|jgi:methionyl-tRNA formyltransferase|nr:formyltransferase family protein [Prolixibacteraceae bacterium]
MNYVFAGDRHISVEILKYLVSQGYLPKLIIGVNNGSHVKELKKISDVIGVRFVLVDSFRSYELQDLLTKYSLDYIFGIHFPLIIPKWLLDIPKIGFINLHPAYLPFNKGWHTPSWAIIDETPIGGTLHFMTEELDAGDIIHQKRIDVRFDDTADKLYQKLLKCEYDVFVEALPLLLSCNPPRIKQSSSGTSHRRSQLFKQCQINLDDSVTWRDAFNYLRAHTTNDISEALTVNVDNEEYSVQIKISRK